jgi:hypothetical protein
MSLYELIANLDVSDADIESSLIEDFITVAENVDDIDDVLSDYGY